jgi:hypothetical protein
MWLLFVPLAILFAVLLATGLLVAGIFSILGAGWPVLLIALGIWMFMHEGRRHQRARHWRQQQVVEFPATIRDWPRDSRKSTTPPKPAKPDVPVDVQLKVESIRKKAAALAEQADRFPPFSQDLYLVRQTNDDYLPRTVETYLRMPRDQVDRPMTPGGKTPHQELKAQLDLLDAKLDEIARELERQNNDRLMANRKFLQDRFELRNQGDDTATLKAESA